MLAQQPTTVLRLFEGGLSSAGYLQAIRERFWNLLEYSSIERVKRIWSERDTLEIGPMERIALIANEFAHGSIDERPWAGASDPAAIFEACRLGVFNLFYLYVRMVKTGVDEAPIVRTLGYLILATLRHYHADLVQELLKVALMNEVGEPLPEKAVDFLLMPIVHSMQDDLQLVCSSDCQRFSREDSVTRWERQGSLENYWSRFSKRGTHRHNRRKAITASSALQSRASSGSKSAATSVVRSTPDRADDRAPRRLSGNGGPRRSPAGAGSAALARRQSPHRTNVEALDLNSNALKTLGLDPAPLAALRGRSVIPIR